MSEQYRWIEALQTPIFFVNTSKVNLDDLCSGIPGAIVRCATNPSDAVLIHVDKNDAMLGCVGGMISDE